MEESQPREQTNPLDTMAKDSCIESSLLRMVNFWYPEPLKRTYCVPPVHFNRVPYWRTSLAGQSVLVAQDASKVAPAHSSRRTTKSIHVKSEARPPSVMLGHQPVGDGIPVSVSEHDARDDFAQQHVLSCLQKLGEVQKEGMFIISQLSFGHYLNKVPHDSPAGGLPKPADLGRQVFDRGDFDVLIMHRRYGILVGEIKSVGLKESDNGKSWQQTVSDVTKRVLKATKQLQKSEAVLRHVTQDLAGDLSVRKTLILPYVHSNLLSRVLDGEDKLQQSFSQELGARNTEEVVALTLCADQLSSKDTPDILDEETFSRLRTWWSLRMGGAADPCMTDDVYVRLISRFVGPATTVSVFCPFRKNVEVRALWEAVSEVGERLSWITLTPRQVDILNQHRRCVCLTGPPGTGKSLLLVLTGLEWLGKGHVVVVVSTTGGSLAASKLIMKQLEVTYGAENLKQGQLRFLKYDMHLKEDDEKKAIKELLEVSKECGELCILMDEAKFAYGKEVGKRLHRLVEEMGQSVVDLSIWAATLEHTNIPRPLEEMTMTQPLRSVPAVVREVKRGLDRYGDTISPYEETRIPPVSDGPRVIRICHEGEHHPSEWPVECFQCGLETARILRLLRVGFKAESDPPPLQYRDVFVLTRSSELKDDTTDEYGNINPASAFVAGLRADGVPARVVCYRDDDEAWEEGVTITALALEDVVTVANHTAVSGLERKVVVFLPGVRVNRDTTQTAEQQLARDRLVAISRCMAQLVMVDMPASQTYSAWTSCEK